MKQTKGRKKILIPAPNAFGDSDIVFVPKGTFIIGRRKMKAFGRIK